jgi:hypothetical protein
MIIQKNIHTTSNLINCDCIIFCLIYHNKGLNIHYEPVPRYKVWGDLKNINKCPMPEMLRPEQATNSRAHGICSRETALARGTVQERNTSHNPTHTTAYASLNGTSCKIWKISELDQQTF